MWIEHYAFNKIRKNIFIVCAYIQIILVQFEFILPSDGSSVTENYNQKFRHSQYNVTIPENSIGKSYVTQVLHEDLMGIEISNTADVKYRIVSGDKENIFKAEARTVGNFAFLCVRTRTSNVVLNREKTDQYELKIKAVINFSKQINFSTYESEALVHIRVLDKNDLSPIFLPAVYSQTIPEDLAIHQSILKVTAEDADLDINGEIYFSFQNENDYFAIHPTSGVISLIKRLSFSENSYFEITVNAADRASIISHSQQASKAKVFVQVEQVNLHNPEIFINSFSNINLNANSSRMCAIIIINDKDSGMHGKIKKVEIIEDNGSHNFLIRPGERSSEYFILVNKYAKIHKFPHIYNITVRAEDMGTPVRYSYKTFPIKFVDDVVEGPIFTKSLYEISIPENSPKNTPIIRLKVTSSNDEKNSLVFLEIVGGNEGEEFRLNPDSGMLYTQKMLDAEVKSFYTLTVSAVDFGNVGIRKQSSAKVKINVQDMNDNDPVFDDFDAVVEINENELSGAFVTKLVAKDRDFGENSYISYSIANTIEVPFEIDHFTGVIRTTTLIDYETMRREYRLRVRASDWGLPFRRQTEVQLAINVKDVNDNRPQFERIDCRGKILRATPLSTDIFTFSAIDFDAGDFITYRIVSGNEEGCFNLNPTSGILSIGCDLRKLLDPKQVLNVSATDGTHYSDEMSIRIEIIDNNGVLFDSGNLLNGFGTFSCIETGLARRLAEIYITSEKNNIKHSDENMLTDHAMISSRYGENVYTPEFIDFPISLHINEGTQLGVVISHIKAFDKDIGYNAKLVFGISGGDNDSVFRIDMDTGEIRIIGYLDRERQDEYTLNITVYDLGRPQKSLSKLLLISILDNNDNPPVLQNTLSNFRLVENIKNESTVFCFNATDADLGNNSKITYSMKPETNDFIIDNSNGCIKTNGIIDREKQASYELFIVAKDHGTPALSAEAVVNIFVDDINDNAPVFGVEALVFKIREDIPKGTVVASIEATDADIGINSEIRFYLKETTADNKFFFKIDEYTGVIKTQNYLDYEKRQIHNVIVHAVDGGNPSLSAEIPIVIEVIDVNENRFAPEFENFVYTGKIRENQPKGSFVLNVTAKDMDLHGPDSRVSYSILGGDGLGLFSINDQGAIQTLFIFDAETKSSYWITICAQDHAIVPLTSCVQVYIEIENLNDNVPLTENPVYYVTLLEGSPAGTLIIKLKATDHDMDEQSAVNYKIISGNPEGYFSIDENTGEITTTERELDRENQAEHTLEILVFDNGVPSLSSTTRVVVEVDDINDNSPVFDQRFYKVQIPSTIGTNESFYQVNAQDNDSGENGRVSYSIKSGKGKNKFKIDSTNGLLYLAKRLDPEVEYEIIVKAEDNGVQKRSQTARINIVEVLINVNSTSVPVIKTRDLIADVTESDHPGFLVSVIQAYDEDGDHLWYSISDGDEKNEFFIGKDNGNVLLSKSLDWETKDLYNLTITVTDGCHTAQTYLYVRVVDTNDNRPQFSQTIYHVNISENIVEESAILQLQATDMDEDKKLFYTLHASQDPSSLEFFRVDSISGNVIVTQRLDYEKKTQHILIVVAKDQGTPAKRNYAKIFIKVLDNNDHTPEFTSKIIQRKIPDSAAKGSKIVQVVAIDRDYGKNAEINYSILTGNVGNVFEMDSSQGIITLASTLNINEVQEYMLQVKATDLGDPPLSSQIPVHVIVIMSENDPPKFSLSSITVEIYENLVTGTFVTQVEALSSSSIFYEILNGNEQQLFRINPSTGVLTINSNIDYETNTFFNLTVRGTNMASYKSNQNVIVHILDVNDNSPFFIQSEYFGEISEASRIGSLVLAKNKTSPLHLKAEDKDTGSNGLIEYTIKEDFARKYFNIDSLTGTIKLLQQLDYESIKTISFSILINDLGTPKLFSESFATVHVNISNVNDCPPVFEKSDLYVDLYIPTYTGIILTQVSAEDADYDEKIQTRYDIVDGNIGNAFAIDKMNGIITTRNIEHLQQSYILHIRASDGFYSTICKVNIEVQILDSDGFTFQKEAYKFSTFENSTKITTIGLVNVVGNTIHENVEYRILTPTTMFQIGSSSGALKTTGVIFDREVQSFYTLVIEARSKIYIENSIKLRRAIVLANISILDINDNCPVFVNLPYFSTISDKDKRGSTVAKVKAIDLDSAENGEVRYEMKKGNGELFKIDRKTGEVILRQNIEKSKSYELIIRAYDNGITPCTTDVSVHLKVVDKAMPYFDKQFYTDTVREDIPLFSSLSVLVQAESPIKNKLIYTISEGNNDELFGLDYRTGVLFVVSELDYESQVSHNIVVRATDTYSGLFAEVMVSINVEDANDCFPNITQDNYYVSIFENSYSGSLIIKVNATDCDKNMNGELSYFIESENGKNTSDLFYIDTSEGSIYLNNGLDFEKCRLHHLVVVVKDHGIPALSSKTNVWVSVQDVNDNAPKFIEPSFSTTISVAAKRRQVVTMAKAFDLDYSDNTRLMYKIVNGNELETYAVEENTGVIRLQNLRNFITDQLTILNVSVTDGIHTTYARIKIVLLPENLCTPIFEKPLYEVSIHENKKPMQYLTIVSATDTDLGIHSTLSYEIVSSEMKDYFEINATTGVITTKVTFDREQRSYYDVIVKVIDGGGKFSHALVKVFIEDINDNSPQFYVKEYKLVAKFNSSQNSSLVKVKGYDYDSNENGLIKYKLDTMTMDKSIENLLKIDNLDGSIYISNYSSKAEQFLQFFVRAFDSGSPELYNEIPVSISFINSEDSLPSFEKPTLNLPLSENTAVGERIAKLKLIGNYSAKISFATETKTFALTENGELILLEVLDREKFDSYYLVGIAETLTAPPLYAYCEINIYVQDENDNDPIFDSPNYNVEIPENMDKLSSILKITAFDKDAGANGDIHYYLEDNEEYAINSEVFGIDLHTGWITLLAQVDREIESEYNFNVIASDNGHPKRLTKTAVSIKILDYNDNAPIVKNHSSELFINENAVPGTVLTQLLIIDTDSVKSEVTFFIIAGDEYSQFQIAKSGDLFVSKVLDRELTEQYNISILVTDGKFNSYSNLTIIVNDINDNFPICIKHRYNLFINESIPIGTILQPIVAMDLDKNGNESLKYYLTGENSDGFEIEKNSGILKVAKQIDREKISKYLLFAHAQDDRELSRECMSEIFIAIGDINDNKPEFSMKQYVVSMSEDAQIETILTKVHATDRDIGKNKYLTYSFVYPTEYFEICATNGIIKLLKNLDRESISSFNITIRAEDHGYPKLYEDVNLILNVLDINDNPPEFTSKQYFASVLENITINSSVIKVYAASKDIGINAEISYFIVGGNEQKRFSINSSTGVIFVIGELDFEKSTTYILTVQAIDGGTPPLTNLASVNITIIDINDNEPKFLQNMYRKSVFENITVGEQILQIHAADEDSGNNALLLYALEAGDDYQQFSMDNRSGWIILQGQLDRELVSSYLFEAKACDAGVPSLCSYVKVQIDVLDNNDNAPLFEKANFSIVLQENKDLDYSLFKFGISDADAIPNTSPYTFDIRQGNEGGFFRIEQDGTLRTAKRFNHKVQNKHELQIRVFDNGTPPLYSDTWVDITVIEESQYPPVIMPLEITVNSFDDEYTGSFLGRVHVSDLDKYDTLTYSISSLTNETYPASKLFNITNDTGMLFAISNLDIGLYKINISVFDGKFTSCTIVKVNVEMISTEMVQNAIIVKFANISPENFILSHRKAFIRSIRSIMRCRQKDVIIITFQTSVNKNLSRRSFQNRYVRDSFRETSEQNLDVVFAVKKQKFSPASRGFYATHEIRKELSNHLEEIEDATNLVVKKISTTFCLKTKCLHGHCESVVLLNRNNMSTFYTDVVSFTAPSYLQIDKCTCKQGFGGRNCDQSINACSSNPCPLQRQCLPSDSTKGYQCTCPNGFSGQNCENKISDCISPNCVFEQASITFSGKSYALYTISKTAVQNILENQLRLSLKVKTVQLTGTLFYASGKIDYNILEIVNGGVQFRFDLGSGEGVIYVTNTQISDGEWHLITLERVLNKAKLIVDSKHISQGSAPGMNGILNIQSNEVMLGAAGHTHPSIIGFEDIRKGFIGCMADIKIGSESLPLYISENNSIIALKRFTNVDFSCNPYSALINHGICGAEPCLNGGLCFDLGNRKFNCTCQPRYTGQRCEVDLDPCASYPCLHSGRCNSQSPGNYSCTCPFNLTGKRCEYGKFCSPNPCNNGGICEEGDFGPHCMCHGYTGLTCEIDVNECDNQPCESGATCINEAGSFRCICPSYLTGTSCGDPLYAISISTQFRNFSIEHISSIVLGIILILTIFGIIMCCVFFKRTTKKGKHKQANKDTTCEPTNFDSSAFEKRPNKSDKKIINVNISGNSKGCSSNQKHFSSNASFVNNLDILRSYGSAGEELENIAFECQKIRGRDKDVNIIAPTRDIACALQNEWCEQMQLKTFSENNFNIEHNMHPLESATELHLLQPSCENLTKVMTDIDSSILLAEYSAINQGEYHWDCSDWVRKSQNPLPDITEVPGAEIADTSSFHSNESNESYTFSTYAFQGMRNLPCQQSIKLKKNMNSTASIHLCEIDDSELEEFLPTMSKNI